MNKTKSYLIGTLSFHCKPTPLTSIYWAPNKWSALSIQQKEPLPSQSLQVKLIRAPINNCKLGSSAMEKKSRFQDCVQVEYLTSKGKSKTMVLKGSRDCSTIRMASGKKTVSGVWRKGKGLVEAENTAKSWGAVRNGAVQWARRKRAHKEAGGPGKHQVWLGHEDPWATIGI